MRVDLDEFDTPEPDKVWKVEVYQDQSGEYLPHPNFHPWDDGVLDWTAKAHNALPALIAELRAARECVRLYKRAGGLGWFFAAYPCTSCNTGVRHDRLDCELVQEAYQRGRDEERAKALSGADAYLKHAITEATNEAYQRGKADERALRRELLDEVYKSIADKLDAEVSRNEALIISRPLLWASSVIVRLRNVQHVEEKGEHEVKR